MKSLDSNYRATSRQEQSKENYLDLEFLLKSSSEKLYYENQDDLQVGKIITSIRKLNEILKDLTLPDTTSLKDDWMTPEKVLQQLGISDRTLSNWRKSGKLPFSHIEQKFFYKKKDIDDLLLKNFSKKEKT